LDDDDEEELPLLLDELLEEFDEFEDELESLSFPSPAVFGGAFSCIGSFFRVIFNFGIWPFETFDDCTWKTSMIRCAGGDGSVGLSVKVGISGGSTLTIEASDSPKFRW
jgi:hypothetical protein